MANGFGRGFTRSFGRNLDRGIALAERGQRREEERRKQVVNLISTTLKLPLEQRAGFLRFSTAALGIELPPEIDKELASFGANDEFMRGLKQLPEVLLNVSRERELAKVPTPELERRLSTEAISRTGPPSRPPALI